MIILIETKVLFEVITRFKSNTVKFHKKKTLKKKLIFYIDVILNDKTFY